MKFTLGQDATGAATARLDAAEAAVSKHWPGGSGQRQPVHSVYGGANLFKPDTVEKLGRIALRELAAYAPDAAALSAAVGVEITPSVYTRVVEKLAREPIEDFRVDFEDGYGVRRDAEEDAHAISSASAAAAAMQSGKLPPFFGFRIKPLTRALRERGMRTFDLFLTALLEKTSGALPHNFVVTLPKVTSPAEPAALAELCGAFEAKAGLAAGALKLEIMIESTAVILNERGACGIPALIEAAAGRCTGAHFGPFDYTSSCGITSKHQHLRHPACDFARTMMQVSLGGTGVFLSDGPTNVLPVPIHRSPSNDAEREENRRSVHAAWALHFDNVTYALGNGFYQGWDLHPAQLPTRYAAVYAFFLDGLEAASERLRNFMEKAAQATMVRDVFDDAASGQGLLNFFLRAIHCGAIQESEAPALTGLSIEELRSGSFVAIMQQRHLLP